MAKKEFNPAEQVDVIVKFIQEYFVNNGTPNTKAVIGISGGKDSTIAAALLVRALGKDRVVCVMMPQGEQTDITDSYKVCDFLHIPDENCFEINIGKTVQTLYDEVVYLGKNEGSWTSPAILTNTPARIRMTTLYMVASAVGGRVCNTGNASEKFIGYTTKYGDLAGDFALFTELTVREIYAIGDYLGLPTHLVHKAPSDGMSGKTDEDNTGIPYDAIDDFLLENKHPNMEIYEKMIAANKRNQHKDCIHLPHPYRICSHLYNASGICDAWCF